MATIPNLPMTDILLHGKPSEKDEYLGFPITRYQNIIGAPSLVTASTIKGSAPFQLLKTDEVELTVSAIRTIRYRKMVVDLPYFQRPFLQPLCM